MDQSNYGSLGNLLVFLDGVVDELERKVWSAAYRYRYRIDEQKELALSWFFQPPGKRDFCERLKQRNIIATLLGLKPREPYIHFERDYNVAYGYKLFPKSSAVVSSDDFSAQARLDRKKSHLRGVLKRRN